MGGRTAERTLFGHTGRNDVGVLQGGVAPLFDALRVQDNFEVIDEGKEGVKE